MTLRLFRGHIGYGAHDYSGLGQSHGQGRKSVSSRRGIIHLREAEVEQLCRSCRRQHDVVGFQIAVKYSAVVRLFQRTRDLDRQPHGLVQGKRALERLAFDVLKDQVIRPDIIELANVGMVQRRNRAGFSFESVAVLGF